MGMTREEAIDILHGMRTDNLNLDDLYTKDKYDALGIAIEALNNALVANVPCEDAISRQEVLDIVDSYSESQSNVEDVTQDIISDIVVLPPVTLQMMDQWKELKETIIEMRDNDGTGTQQEVCKFLVNLMDVLEKQMHEPKTGHWISDAIQGEIDGQIVKGFICSECGAISVFRMTGGKIVNGDLCPNCGCRMIELQESEVQDADSD